MMSNEMRELMAPSVVPVGIDLGEASALPLERKSGGGQGGRQQESLSAQWRRERDQREEEERQYLELKRNAYGGSEHSDEEARRGNQWFDVSGVRPYDSGRGGMAGYETGYWINVRGTRTFVPDGHHSVRESNRENFSKEEPKVPEKKGCLKAIIVAPAVPAVLYFLGRVISQLS